MNDFNFIEPLGGGARNQKRRRRNNNNIRFTLTASWRASIKRKKKENAELAASSRFYFIFQFVNRFSSTRHTLLCRLSRKLNGIMCSGTTTGKNHENYRANCIKSVSIGNEPRLVKREKERDGIAEMGLAAGISTEIKK